MNTGLEIEILNPWMGHQNIIFQNFEKSYTLQKKKKKNPMRFCPVPNMCDGLGKNLLYGA